MSTNIIGGYFFMFTLYKRACNEKAMPKRRSHTVSHAAKFKLQNLSQSASGNDFTNGEWYIYCEYWCV